MDSVVVLVDKKFPSAKKLSSRIDIGLNLISRYKNKIVPEFIKIENANNDAFGRNKYNQF